MFKFNHIGYATTAISKTEKEFRVFGYAATSYHIDPIQKVRVAFLEKQGEPTIELVEGLNSENSPIRLILEKNGVSPYHICYTVPSIGNAIKVLRQGGFLPIFEPTRAIAFQGRLIVYLFHKNIGLVELVEDEIPNF